MSVSDEQLIAQLRKEFSTLALDLQIENICKKYHEAKMSDLRQQLDQEIVASLESPEVATPLTERDVLCFDAGARNAQRKHDSLLAIGWDIEPDAAACLRDFIGDEEAAEITLSIGRLRDDDNKIEYGLRCHLTEYPEEGGLMLVIPNPEQAGLVRKTEPINPTNAQAGRKKA